MLLVLPGPGVIVDAVTGEIKDCPDLEPALVRRRDF